jgi:hypothetical protein
MEINISLAAYPGMRVEKAAMAAIGACSEGTLSEPLLGALSASHVQLVPQNFGLLDEEVCDYLVSAYPQTRFRLHANVRVLNKHLVADASGLQLFPQWFEAAARLSKHIHAPAYSLHAGMRDQADMNTMFDNARRIADLFDCPVAVEGQYPTPGETYLVATWEEYRQLFESGIPYALDLSHLNIVAHKTRRLEEGLVKEMLECDRCIEVHVSANDGRGDQHSVCQAQTWWYPLLNHINKDAVVFSEGNHRITQKETAHAETH